MCGQARARHAWIDMVAATLDIGEFTRANTIPASGTFELPYFAIIPLDAAKLIVSMKANTTNAKLIAV